MLDIDADIYAFNELEATDIILKQLADSLNKYGNATFAAVADNISYTPDNYDNHLKSGFIYVTDKVRPYGTNTAATNTVYYRNVMRIQTFEDILSGERFTLSMNHFKAGGDDEEGDREKNAEWLLTALGKQNNDPDILVMGDLNSIDGSTTIEKIKAAGYEEQLLKYTPGAYSYTYKGQRRLIDHVFANSTMAEQVTDAWVDHVCTNNWKNPYSDHDPYIVMLNLSSGEDIGDGDYVYRESFSSSLGSFTMKNVTGKNDWFISNQTTALMNGYSSGLNEDWLISPAFDLSQKGSATVKFTHSVNFGQIANWGNHLKLLVAADYNNDPATATWIELPISFPSKKQEWETVSISLPQELMGEKHINIAFRYITTNEDKTNNDIPAWSVKDFSFTAKGQVSTAIMDMAAEPQREVRKIVVNGRCYIQTPDGKRYTLTGTELK
jgi:endonuclease/exonuclease/phosphatase family metal-dependent hydrolase